MATDTQWAYLAGLIDGEGCIHSRLPRGKNPAPVIVISQAYPTVLNWCLETFQLGYIQERKHTKSKYLGYAWCISQNALVKQVLESVYPYLVLKKDQAEVALELCKRTQLTQERRLELHQLLKDLKRPERELS